MDALPPRSAWHVLHPEERSGPPRLEGLIEPGVDALAVRIVIQQDGFVTGWDDGALGFEEDAVWFSGWASSFRVFARDVRSSAFDRLAASRASEAWLLHRGFPLRHPSREVWIRTSVLRTDVRRHHEEESRLAEEIRRLWLLGTGRGESEYPPLSIRPGAKVWYAADSLPMESVTNLRPVEGLYGRLLGGILTYGLSPTYEEEEGRLLHRIADEEARDG